MIILEVLELTKIFNGKIAVNSITFNIPENLFVTILGPNGAGKTTLLNMIVGILPPTKGKIIIKGLDVWKNLDKVRKFIGFVPQEEGIWRDLTVYENLMNIANYYGLPSREAKRRVLKILDLLNLKDYKNKIASKLSGGYKKRLSIAMALVHDPEILIMDEPTTGLDPSIRYEFLNFIKNLTKEGKTILMSTHIVEEAEISDKVLIMHEGKLIAYDQPEVLKTKISDLHTVIELNLNKVVSEELIKKLTSNWLILKTYGNYIKLSIKNYEQELPEIIRIVESYNFKVEEVKIRKPTLGEVFLKLTGTEISEEQW